MVFFLTWYYIFITYDGQKSNEERPKTKKQRATRKKLSSKVSSNVFYMTGFRKEKTFMYMRVSPTQLLLLRKSGKLGESKCFKAAEKIYCFSSWQNAYMG